MVIMEYLIVFSICNNMILRRKEVMAYLQLHVKNIQLNSIELEDNRFTMSLKADGLIQNKIQELARLKGLQIGFISCELIGDSSISDTINLKILSIPTEYNSPKKRK